jgi:hypothetical protein
MSEFERLIPLFMTIRGADGDSNRARPGPNCGAILLPERYCREVMGRPVTTQTGGPTEKAVSGVSSL